MSFMSALLAASVTTFAATSSRSRVLDMRLALTDTSRVTRHTPHRDELRGRACHLVRRDNESLVRVSAGEHTVGRLDVQVRRECDRAYRGDETLHPPVITFAELL
jgi:hypothetical protein